MALRGFGEGVFPPEAGEGRQRAPLKAGAGLMQGRGPCRPRARGGDASPAAAAPEGSMSPARTRRRPFDIARFVVKDYLARAREGNPW